MSRSTFRTMDGEFPIGSMSSILSTSALYFRRIHSARQRGATVQVK